LALVGQSAATYEHLSVLENLKFAEQLSGQVNPGLRQELLGQFGLGSTLEQKPSELSGGQLQRLAIVRALLTQRPLLLMDEPLAHLQESLRGPIRRLLRNWQQAHKLTCIYVTHDSLEACEISDRLSVIGQGKPLQTAAPGELYRHPNSREVAELMGRPSIQWIQVPESDKHVGLRPADWQLISVGSSSIGSEELVEIEPDRVRTIGRLVAIRQVESWTWLEVQVKEHRLVAVRQESPAPQSNEQGRSAWQELKIDDRVELINTQPIWIDAGS
jgi:ABC-type sugar transport system ATPase subunit